MYNKCFQKMAKYNKNQPKNWAKCITKKKTIGGGCNPSLQFLGTENLSPRGAEGLEGGKGGAGMGASSVTAA